ncbi:hypothetical protein Q762_14830 [Flavobacterium cauense R2A-7]|nr:hypothetical protein Q762_14830 [Flavobacterium cauense R2A-7]
MTSISNELSLILRVAKVETLFKSRKLFLKYFSIYFQTLFQKSLLNIFKNFPCFAGCKSKNSFQISQAFLKKISIYFRSLFRFAYQYFK